MVLDTICDDFENVDQRILPVVAEDCGKLGLVVERPEIVGILKTLVGDGLARAYDLSQLSDRGNPFSGALRNMPSLDEVEDRFKTYFYITDEGRAFHTADETWWPFDEKGERLPNWQLEE